MSWFKREGHTIVNDAEKTVRTEGLWIKCGSCSQFLFKADLEANLQVCPKCAHHFRFDARGRIDALLEPGYTLVDLDLKSTDPLDFTDLKPYKKRLAEAQKKTGLNDAIVNEGWFIPTYEQYVYYGYNPKELKAPQLSGSSIYPTLSSIQPAG